MAINISSSQDGMLEQMTSLVFTGSLDSALQVLEKSELSEGQKGEIKTILAQQHGDYTSENAQSVKQRLVAVIRGEDVQPAAPSQQTTSSQALVPLEQEKYVAFEPYPDIVNLLFNACLSQCDLKTITALPCINKYWKAGTEAFFAGCDLAQMCPELTILDAKTQGRECNDEPEIPKFELFQWVKKIAPHVEGNAGVTLLTMIKGTTLNQLTEIAEKEGIRVDISWNPIIAELEDVPVEQTYRILVTNSVFLGSRNKSVDAQKVIVEGHGCEMPIVQEYVALCVNTTNVFNKCLYEQTPPTYGRSSTRVQGIPLLIGDSALGYLYVRNYHFGTEYDVGAGGQRKF